ncbi:MAG: hypothetical protein QOJ89_3561 [bacterium]
MMRPSPPQLFAEMARLADRFGWGRDTLLELEHRERRRWLAELDRLGGAS